MDKKNYLTREEQILFSPIKNTDVIDNAFIKELFPTYSSQKINKICHNLIKKGYFYQIKRGTYLINDTPSQHPMIKNPFTIALHINNGYIGFSSALRVYNLTTYEPFTIFIVHPTKSQSVEIGNYLFKTVSMGKRATGATFYKNMYISNMEKTIFDCFYKPQYAGGYREIINALSNKPKINWYKLLNYFKRFASPALFQRSGYILALLTDEKIIQVPDFVINTLKKKKKNTTRLLPSKKSKGTYVKEWKLLDNIGKKTLLSKE